VEGEKNKRTVKQSANKKGTTFLVPSSKVNAFHDKTPGWERLPSRRSNGKGITKGTHKKTVTSPT